MKIKRVEHIAIAVDSLRQSIDRSRRGRTHMRWGWAHP